MSWSSTLSKLTDNLKAPFLSLDSIKNVFDGGFDGVVSLLEPIVPSSSNLKNLIKGNLESKKKKVEELLEATGSNPLKFVQEASSLCREVIDEVTEQSGDIIEDAIDALEGDDEV